MSSKIVPEAPESYHSPFGQEVAPSALREDEPSFARLVGMTGLGLVFVGAAVMFFNRFSPRWIGPAWGQAFVILGLAGLLFHAARDADVQIRRTYGVLGGFLLIALGVALSLVPFGGHVGAQFLPWGALALLVGLLFLLPFARHEDDPAWRRTTLATLTIVGVALAAVGFIGGNVSADFLPTYGLTAALLGLFYLWSAIGLLGADSDRGHWLGRFLLAAGALVVLIAVARSAAPLVVSGAGRFLVPSGLLLTGLGLLYAFLAVGLTSERQLVVLTRRELAAYFYSPIAYLVLFGMTVVCWLNYLLFVLFTLSSGQVRSEPIVREYIVALVPVFGVIFVVPAITMRLLSEERRTGTFEVLLTAPLGEGVVVLSKFLAALIFFLVLCLPLGLFLIAVRLEGGRPFDYLPLLSFYVALICSGAAFVAMGLFFSALTRNQIVAAVLTFMGMTILLGIYLVERSAPVGPAGAAVLKQFSFVDLWIDSLGGKLYVRDIVMQLSVAAFWLFLTVKVLDARKWS
jgi:ABC-type transport system involved in multi-copper enzyme maturation permease subunit